MTKQQIIKYLGKHIKESNMTSKNTSTGEQQAAKPDLSANYRPVGLKAVAAASLMAKNKPGSIKKSA